MPRCSSTGSSWSAWCASRAGSRRSSADESDAYFASRPLDSRIGAWASPQSEVISGRDVLVANAAVVRRAVTCCTPPRPPHWGGYRLVPDRWQFWQGRKSRLHDRLRYTLRRTAAGCASGWRPEAVAACTAAAARPEQPSRSDSVTSASTVDTTTLAVTSSSATL